MASENTSAFQTRYTGTQRDKEEGAVAVLTPSSGAGGGGGGLWGPVGGSGPVTVHHRPANAGADPKNDHRPSPEKGCIRFLLLL